MKKILSFMVVMMLFSTIAFGQNFKAPVFEFKLNQHHELFKIEPPKLTMKTPKLSFDTTQLTFNKGLLGFHYERIIILPLDNMPCYVPPIQTIIQIPVLKENGYVNNIPNALKK